MKFQVSDLTFSYPGQKVLEHLSFEVEDGEFVSILGPSGCGKSTLLNVLSGIRRPEGGKLFLQGQERRWGDGPFAYMPQKDLLFPWKTILDNVCLYGEIHHTKEDIRAKASQQMERFGLAGCQDKYPEELSGGMRQRAAFLRTTLCPAEIYLLDEPFGALDVITRSDMQDWLRQLCLSLNKTILLVTHDTDEAIYLSDRILVMGQPGDGILQEIVIEEKERSRQWLYRQGELRSLIYRMIKGEK